MVIRQIGARGLPRARCLVVDTCAAAACVPLVTTCGAAIVALILGEDWLSQGVWI